MEAKGTVFYWLYIHSSSSGREVYSDGRVPGAGSGAAELLGPGRPAERHGVHLSRGPLEPRNHFTGNVLRNETETHSQISGMEGKLRRCFRPASFIPI